MAKKLFHMIYNFTIAKTRTICEVWSNNLKPDVWAGTSSCYLEMYDKLQKWICRTFGPSLAAFLEPLAYHKHVASLSLFYRYYFCRCSSELAELVPFPYFQGRSNRYSIRLHDLSDCNETWTHNHLVRKWTLNRLAKLANSYML